MQQYPLSPAWLAEEIWATMMKHFVWVKYPASKFCDKICLNLKTLQSVSKSSLCLSTCITILARAWNVAIAESDDLSKLHHVQPTPTTTKDIWPAISSMYPQLWSWLLWQICTASVAIIRSQVRLQKQMVQQVI